MRLSLRQAVAPAFAISLLVTVLPAQASVAATASEPYGAVLPSGKALKPGQRLRSPNGAFTLNLEASGNLVVRNAKGSPIWQSATRRTGATTLHMQSNGNLVLRDSSGTAVWYTNTGTQAGAKLTIQNDGNAVLYRGVARWNSKKPAFNTVARPLTANERAYMTGRVWRAGCPVPLSDLRSIAMPYKRLVGGDTDTGVLVVHQNQVAEASAAFKEMYNAGFQIRRMIPIEEYGGDDARSMAWDNTSAFNCRPVTGGTSFSLHSRGVAIDINPIENPYVKGSIVEPAAGKAYLNRSAWRPGMIVASSVATRSFEARGWTWGGRWSSLKDYQHLEN